MQSTLLCSDFGSSKKINNLVWWLILTIEVFLRSPWLLCYAATIIFSPVANKQSRSGWSRRDCNAHYKKHIHVSVLCATGGHSDSCRRELCRVSVKNYSESWQNQRKNLLLKAMRPNPVLFNHSILTPLVPWMILDCAMGISGGHSDSR
jgi:hypothetical protein